MIDLLVGLVDLGVQSISSLDGRDGRIGHQIKPDLG